MVQRSSFGTLPAGHGVDAFTLTNANGVHVQAITYGAIITSIVTPDRHGRSGDITLGHGTLDDYLRHKTYFGALVGRHANRIRRGRFRLGENDVQLVCNEGANHLHGGREGFDARLWTAEPLSSDDGDGVTFTLESPDGDQGYPGALRVTVQYLLNDDNELQIEYDATTDADTIVNLTQHSYFNLSAGSSVDVLGHELTLHADAFTPIDEELLTTGAIEQVAGTPFDFTTPRRIGERIDEAHDQLERAGGYDHNWVLRRTGPGLAEAARLSDPVSGRTLDVFTTEPGIQFYSGNKLDGTVPARAGGVYSHRAGLCLETQHYPGGPNHPHFPTPVLRPSDRYRSVTVFRFGS